ncbi:MAG: hypothetical protein WC341_12250, partial [Bacteroidales bacterium]
GISLSYSDAPNINELGGTNVNLGASFAVAGYDWNKCLENGYTTQSVSAFYSIGLLKAEMHCGITYTIIYDQYNFGGE